MTLEKLANELDSWRDKPKPAEPAIDHVAIMRENLAKKGYCLLECPWLDGEIITLARDDSYRGSPDGPVVYTLSEMRMMQDVKDWYLIHRLKQHGARLISPEIPRKGARA